MATSHDRNRLLVLTPLFLFAVHAVSVGQPQFWFDPLPELPGGASEAFSIAGPESSGFLTIGYWSVGRALDGDGINKAVIWTKPQGEPWQIEKLPNPFGNTESSALGISCTSHLDVDDILRVLCSIGGYANNVPVRVCVGGPEPGTPCTSDENCFPGGTCPPASEPSPQPVVWTGDGVGPWTAEVLPLPPGALGGSAIFTILRCPGGYYCPSPESISVGRIIGSDGVPKAGLWRRNEATQTWTVQLLPDYGPGSSSEATSVGDNPTDPANPDTDGLIIGGAVQTDTNPKVPCVWEQLPGGGFDRIDLPMTPGAYLGSVLQMLPDGHRLSAGSVGFNASIAGLADLYRGTLWRRTAGVWGAPLELPPLPGLRDSRATSTVRFRPGPNDAGQYCLGHSYFEPSENTERATLWEVQPDNTITVYDLNSQTVNLPTEITLAFGRAAPIDIPFNRSIGGTFRNDSQPAVPHANILILLSATDCNENGMDDAIDLYLGTSADSNGNVIPDECEPRFSFEALPELPGGASEAFGAGADFPPGQQFPVYPKLAGRSLDGDGINKAVVWTKPQGQPWQIEVLPNPFGNTESSALGATIKDSPSGGHWFYISGSANTPGGVCSGGGNSGNPCTVNADCPGGACLSAGEGSPQPVVWTGDGVGPWTSELPPLPPGAVGGSVSFVVTDNLPSPQLSAVGHVNRADGTTRAALWSRDEATQTWTVELLPDYGPGFSSEATSGAIDPVDPLNPNDDLLIIGGSVQTETNPQVPCVWQELPGGGFERTDLPIIPGAPLDGGRGQLRGVLGRRPPRLLGAIAVGLNWRRSAIRDVYRGVLYRRVNGVWGAPLELPPLPGMSDSRATGVAVGTHKSPNGLTIVGHSDNGPGTERATFWEVHDDGEIFGPLDLNDLTVNLPPGVTLAIADDFWNQLLSSMAGTFTNDPAPTAGPASTPHAYVLTQLCTTDAQCNDGRFCNGQETCDLSTGQCQSGPPPVCDDGLPCTIEACDPASDACLITCEPAGTVCDDGNPLTIDDQCQPSCQCMGVIPPPPNDIVWDPATNPTPWPNNNPLATTRSLRFTVTGPPVPSKLDAIRVTMVDLQHPDPRNLAQYPPPSYSAFDTGTHGTCGGAVTSPNYNMHHCGTTAECLGPNNGISTDDGTSCSAGPACTGDVAATNLNNAQGSCARWVGKPGTFYEAQGPPQALPYRASRLQCAPAYYDWKSEPGGLVTVVGAEILPSSEYSVQTYASTCLGAEVGCPDVSAAVKMYTRRKGDLVATFQTPSPDTLTQANAIDVSQSVDAVKHILGAPTHVRAQMQANLPDLTNEVNVLDIVEVVDSLKRTAYSFFGPCPCPSTVTCGGSCTGCAGMCVRVCTSGDIGQPCTKNLDCGAGGTCAATGTCRDKCGRCTP